MEQKKRIVIVGGVAGGASAAARLRRLDESAEIVLLERGAHISFANCGLPYYIGGDIKRESALTLQTPESFHARFAVDVRVHCEVLSVDRHKKHVTVRNHSTGTVYTQPYDALILSPGAKPIRPDIPGISDARVFTLRNIPDTLAIKQFMDAKRPQRAVIVGGGYIGIEMAENLAKAGLSVTVVERASHIIAPLDAEMAAHVQTYLAKKGIQVLTNASLTAIEGRPDALHLTLSNQSIEADFLILAIGVSPDTAFLQDAGIAMNARGGIQVDDGMRTSDPHIYAVGDAVEVMDFVTKQKAMIPLAGPANKQGRIAADQICGLGSTYAGTQGSAVMKIFDMTIATTGLNERTAKALSIPAEKVYTYAPSHATYYPGASELTMKVLFDPSTGRILGAQVLGGDGADKRCDVLATVIRFGGDAKALTSLELCYAPPISSAKDPVNMIGYMIENVLTGQVRLAHVHAIPTILRDPNAVLLDVRTDGEVAQGAIAGSVHIPLDDLRNRLSELDPSKPLYVMCRIGMRGYVACRILSQNGFTCYNISGGYLLYSNVLAADMEA